MKHEVPTIQGIPVLLPPHDHPEFGTPGQHYHVDFRYCSDQPRQDRVIHSDEKPIMLSLELIRHNYTIQSGALAVVHFLSEKYKGERAKCGKCPHKGLPIMNGLCTGHGMAFNTAGYPEQDYHIRIGPELHSESLYFDRNLKLYEFKMSGDGTARWVEMIVGSTGKHVAKLPLSWVPYLKDDLLRITIN